MSRSIHVVSLSDNSRHDIPTKGGDMTIRQLKEELHRSIPFFQNLKICREVMQLSVEGEGVLEEDCLVSCCGGGGDLKPINLRLEQPLDPVCCGVCNKNMAAAHGDSASAAAVSRAPRLLNCRHAVCCGCLTRGLANAEEQLADKVEVDMQLELPSAETAEKQKELAAERKQAREKRKREREKTENMLKFVCPLPDCGMTSFWRRDQEWPSHDSMERLCHLRMREKREAETFPGKCWLKSCPADGMFWCSECNDSFFCHEHCDAFHRIPDLSVHEPICFLGNAESFPAWRSRKGVLIDRFCCHCRGTGETLVPGENCLSGGRHCEHGDAVLRTIGEVAGAEVVERLAALKTLQSSSWKHVHALNGVLEQIQESRVDGAAQICQHFDELIARLQTRKEGMLREVRHCYREKELAVLEKIELLTNLLGEVEAGIVYYSQLSSESKHLESTENELNDGKTKFCKFREFINPSSIRKQLDDVVAMIGTVRPERIDFSFVETEDFITGLGKIALDPPKIAVEYDAGSKEGEDELLRSTFYISSQSSESDTSRDNRYVEKPKTQGSTGVEGVAVGGRKTISGNSNDECPDYGEKEFEATVSVFAHYLGIDLEKESDLIYIAREALCTLPRDWELGIGEGDNSFIPYFFNLRTDQSVWKHPNEGIFIRRVKEEREKKIRTNHKNKEEKTQTAGDCGGGQSLEQQQRQRPSAKVNSRRPRVVVDCSDDDSDSEGEKRPFAKL